MCGRTACTLEPGDVQQAFNHEIKKQNYSRNIEWKPNLTNKKYFPSYNLGPTKNSPVIVSQIYFERAADDKNYSMLPMSWGIKPINSQVEYPTLVNARTETVLEKPTFKFPLKKGQRCVILADGYYEWQRHKERKQPFFIHFPQPEGVKIYDHSWKKLSVDDACQGNVEWKGPRLLTMAGIFNTVKTHDQTYLAYVVLTVEASPTVSHIHDRMPAILDGMEAVDMWLNGAVPPEKALDQLKPIDNLCCYEVSSLVNNVRNDTEICYQPYIMKKNNASQMFMQNWLKRKHDIKPVDDTQKIAKKKLDNTDDN